MLNKRHAVLISNSISKNGVMNIIFIITFRPFTNQVISGTGFEGPDVHVASKMSPTLTTSLEISINGSTV